jgi:phosphoribosylamine---glycine ligase
MAMNILVIGGGGREHALAWTLSQSSSVDRVACAPGNDGMARNFSCYPLDLKDADAAAELAARVEADLTIVGPELPLVYGIADEFARRNLAILGPTQQAAELEGSKVFAKEFLMRHSIPTAEAYAVCESAQEARAAISGRSFPVVLKADGLCAGKGVLVAGSEAEALEFIDRAFTTKEFGDAGECLSIEEALQGDELSYIILTDGRDFIRMAPARDHKRAFDGDQGPNTGGMGVYSTDEILPPVLERTIIDSIVRPTLSGLASEGIPYRGFLYFGLMLTPDGPRVLEFNCRLGDPETEAVLLRANFDFADACARAARGQLKGFRDAWSTDPSICVVIASKGYPSAPATGIRIEGLDQAAHVSGAVIFHAGTKHTPKGWETNGGRVLVVSASAKDLAGAREIAYEAVQRIRIEGSHYRRDIGMKAAEEIASAAAVRKAIG